MAGALSADAIDPFWLHDPLAREVMMLLREKGPGEDAVVSLCRHLDRPWCARRVLDELNAAPAVRSRRGLDELVAHLKELASRRRLIGMCQSVSARLRCGAIGAAAAAAELRDGSQ